MTLAVEVPPEVQALIERGALFVVNHSGGKDSQAMMITLRRIVPARQLVVMHAVLPEVEWPNVIDHIKRTIGRVPLHFAHATKTFFEMVEHRQMFPSPAYRQCTSDLKRGPLDRETRHYLKAHPEFSGLVVNCMGMRAEESTSRAKLVPFKLSKANSLAGREWYEWLPIHNLRVAQVFATIHAAREKPHWAYRRGMTRLSCCFCIMASQHDLRTAAKLAPDLYKRYVETERRLNFTLSPSRKFLTEITGVDVPVA